MIMNKVMIKIKMMIYGNSIITYYYYNYVQLQKYG